MSADTLALIKAAETKLREYEFELPVDRIVYLSLAVSIELHRLPAFASDIARLSGIKERVATRLLDKLVGAGLVEKRPAIGRDVYFLPSDHIKDSE
jgi:DNA-binding MarR family transcriptional regulator